MPLGAAKKIFFFYAYLTSLGYIILYHFMCYNIIKLSLSHEMSCSSLHNLKCHAFENVFSEQWKLLSLKIFSILNIIPFTITECDF